MGVSANNQCLPFIFTAGVSNILRREGGISKGQMGHFSVGCQFQITGIENQTKCWGIMERMENIVVVVFLMQNFIDIYHKN